MYCIYLPKDGVIHVHCLYTCTVYLYACWELYKLLQIIIHSFGDGIGGDSGGFGGDSPGSVVLHQEAEY